jgi:transcriptional regulator with XRE-family HTH domain
MPKDGPNPIDIHVGTRIRTRRTMLGLSQEKLATGLGITFQQVQKYEKGMNRVGASRLQNIAVILNVPISYFFADESSPLLAKPNLEVDVDVITSFVSSQQGLELNRAFVRLDNAKVRNGVVQLVKSIARTEDILSGGDDVPYHL